MDLVTLITNLNIIIGMCYLLLSFLIVLVPFQIKTMRVLGIWGAVMAFHAIVFLTGCGLHHFEYSGHIGATTMEIEAAAVHFLITAVMQVYGALGVAAVGIFRGHRMMDRLKSELADTEKKENI